MAVAVYRFAFSFHFFVCFVCVFVEIVFRSKNCPLTFVRSRVCARVFRIAPYILYYLVHLIIKIYLQQALWTH